eukprot:TRINITY_DN14283_c0_g1_i1.p4 TRINITY_DN14283_c0_g1~~TRINITY_DN14283_c0_g1_i1.p4  ORF type:complete len:102 (+),score=1.13 TRINITY_DN14283_c0_g1_i1:49-354(+)
MALEEGYEDFILLVKITTTFNVNTAQCTSVITTPFIRTTSVQPHFLWAQVKNDLSYQVKIKIVTTPYQKTNEKILQHIYFPTNRTYTKNNNYLAKFIMKNN